MNRLLLCLLLVLASCGSKKQTLHIYSWAEYINYELIEQFEKAKECVVVVDTFDSNESMFAKLHLGGISYDIIIPSNYFLEIMHKHDLLQPINKEALPNLNYLDQSLFSIIGKELLHWGVPYMMTPTGLGYRKDKPLHFTPSWSMFERQELKGRMTMLNDPREALGAALKFLGYSVNTKSIEELQAATKQLIQWKRNLAKFESEQYKNGIASGEYLVVQGYSGDILQVIAENPSVEFALPVEGTTTSIDFLVIPKNAQNVSLAHEFINFLLEPENAKVNMESTSYLSPNTKAISLLNPALKARFEQFLSPESLAKIEVIQDVGPRSPAYNKAWDEVKAA